MCDILIFCGIYVAVWKRGEGLMYGIDPSASRRVRDQIPKLNLCDEYKDPNHIL